MKWNSSPHWKELGAPAYDQVHKWVLQLHSSLLMNAALAGIETASSWEALSQNHPAEAASDLSTMETENENLLFQVTKFWGWCVTQQNLNDTGCMNQTDKVGNIDQIHIIAA